MYTQIERRRNLDSELKLIRKFCAPKRTVFLSKSIRKRIRRRKVVPYIWFHAPLSTLSVSCVIILNFHFQVWLGLQFLSTISWISLVQSFLQSSRCLQMLRRKSQSLKANSIVFRECSTMKKRFVKEEGSCEGLVQKTYPMRLTTCWMSQRVLLLASN